MSTWRRRSPWRGHRSNVGGGRSPLGRSPSAGDAQAPRRGLSRIPAPPPLLASCAPTGTPTGSRTEPSRTTYSIPVGARKSVRLE